MGTFTYADKSIDGDIYIQKLSNYVRRNEEALANGLLCFSKSRSNTGNVKPIRIKFTIHHLYFICERLESSLLGVKVGPLNVKLDIPNHEPTFISFMANNARSGKHIDSDSKSITSMNSVKSMVSTASAYWRLSLNFSKDPNIINRDLRYLYSSFTKLPCLILTRQSSLQSISMYEEYPCDTSVPLIMFKNLQVLELVGYEPNEIFGWHLLSEQLRILVIRDSKLNNLADCLFNLVFADETGRRSFSGQKHGRKLTESCSSAHATTPSTPHEHFEPDTFLTPSPYLTSKHSDHSSHYLHVTSPSPANNQFRSGRRKRASTLPVNADPAAPKPASEHLGSAPSLPYVATDSTVASSTSDSKHLLGEEKWCLLKQLTVLETSILAIPGYVFKPLCNVVRLNLSHNLLTEIPPGLSLLHNVKYLNFSDNYIEKLDNLPLNLQHLSLLNLGNNKLKSLTGLENLVRAEKVDLRHNELVSINDLKPLVRFVHNHPGLLQNVFLSSNKLPKTYRIDLFNFFNGINYKSSIKIDDLRPGYFEGALLVDRQVASRNLHEYLDIPPSTGEPMGHTLPAKDEPVPATLPILTNVKTFPGINQLANTAGSSPNYSTHTPISIATLLQTLTTGDSDAHECVERVPRNMLEKYNFGKISKDFHSPPTPTLDTNVAIETPKKAASNAFFVPPPTQTADFAETPLCDAVSEPPAPCNHNQREVKHPLDPTTRSPHQPTLQPIPNVVATLHVPERLST